MKIEQGKLSAETLSAVVMLLKGAVPDLTPATLVNAIKSFSTENKPRDNTEKWKLFSRHEAADILRVSQVTLDKFIRTGVLGSLKIGRRVLIPSDVLRNFITVKDKKGGGSRHEVKII